MKVISDVLKGFFTFLLYPALIIALFGFIVVFIVRIVSEGSDLYSRIRRLTGAFLPVVILIFVVLVSDQENEPVKTFLVSVPVLIHLFFGAIAGFATEELGRYLMRSSADTGPSVYSLFLSSVGVFILYSLMQQILGSLNYFLFGLAILGGLDVIFRGPPLSHQRSRAFNSEGEAAIFKKELWEVRSHLEMLRNEIKNSKRPAEYVGAVPASYISLETRIQRLESQIRDLHRGESPSLASKS